MDPSQQAMSSGAITSMLKHEGSAEGDGGHVDGAALMLGMMLSGFILQAIPGCKYKGLALGGKGNGKMGVFEGDTNLGACFAIGSAVSSLLPDLSAFGLPGPVMEFMKFCNPRTNDDIGRKDLDAPMVDTPFAPPASGDGSSSSGSYADSGGGGSSHSLAVSQGMAVGAPVSMAELGMLSPAPTPGGMSAGISMGMGG